MLVQRYILLKIVLNLIRLFPLIKIAKCSSIDFTYCRKYNITLPPTVFRTDAETRGYPFIYMGSTWEKHYFMSNEDYEGDFFWAALSHCPRFDMELATIKTPCEYKIVKDWFFKNYPTEYYAWIAGMRLGNYMEPKWVTTGEPVDLAPLGVDVDVIPGPYPPGGYSPIPYPWVNCMCLSRNCPIFTSGPTSPCEQSSTYPDVQFGFADCRSETFRVICERNVLTN